MVTDPPRGDTPPGGRDFIRQMVDRDLAAGRYDGVLTRFPPEPNGYLHLGHAKSICLNFGLARDYGGRCNLRFDDTNPLTEDEEYTRAIQEDVRWLGFEFGEPFFASDYFERMYAVASDLVRRGKAYVDSATEEEIREARGTVTRPGTPTRDRDRPPEESLDLFRRMREGEFPDGSLVLRGRIDLASPNMLMRDPIFYRIRHAHHYRTGDSWCIYPLYDFAHCLEDAFEGVTHSLCTLEFENNRELYDWILDEAGFQEPRPHQTEFARLNLEFTVLSKRKLIRLVREGHVRGWDDPRMPTIAGLRRRGVPAGAVRRFADLIGVARADSRVDVAKLDFAIRETLNESAPRLLAVLEPLKVVLTNVPDGWREAVPAPLFPDDGPTRGTREIPVTRELAIDRDDFSEDPPRGWKRLSPGGAVRLRHAFVIRCDEVVRDPDSGAPVQLLCRVDSGSLDGAGEGWKVSGAVHWVSLNEGVPAEVRLYDRLFLAPDPEEVPEEDGDFTVHLNPDSLRVMPRALVEPAWDDPAVGSTVQFERLGYFALDPDSTTAHPVFNRVVTLRDGWARRRADTPAAVASSGEDRGGAGKGARANPPGDARAPSEERVPSARDLLREAHPELRERLTRYRALPGISPDDADLLSGERLLGDLFEAALAVHPDAPVVAAWITNDLRAAAGDRPLEALPVEGGAVGRLAALVAQGRVARPAAREVLATLVESGGDPEEIVRDRGLEAVADPEALRPTIREALAARPDKVAEYRSGRTNLLGLFMGDVMRASGGRADPGLVRRLLQEELDEA